jgi:bacillithiol biosynthesis deacetylase BshB1
MTETIDFLCIGAHADDIELGMGGTVAKMVRLGHRGLLVDLTDGAMGTRGTPEQRLSEAEESARILGVRRRNLGFPDGTLRPDEPVLLERIVALFRETRPRIVFTHPLRDRHPDHEAVSEIVRQACFKSGLAKWPAPGEAYRPNRLFHWMGPRQGDPDFCVDVTHDWPARLDSIRAYGSQFGEQGPETAISGSAFHGFLVARARYLGSRIRADLAEGFTCDELPEVADPCDLGTREF